MKILYVLLAVLRVKLAVASSITTDEGYRRQRGEGKMPRPNKTSTEWEKEDFEESNILNPITEPIWEFEEVDYNTVVGPLKQEYQDCYGLNIRCLLDRYHSQCELDYDNCMQRVYKQELPTYGNSYRDDYSMFYGEGYNCDELETYG